MPKKRMFLDDPSAAGRGGPLVRRARLPRHALNATPHAQVPGDAASLGDGRRRAVTGDR
ncbi:hypothetical protein [Streptomyces sp. NPDC002067]